jgi:hypothetical protein
MTQKKRSLRSIQKERVLKAARKYNNKTDFHNYDRNAWRTAKKLGIYNECTAHMVIKQRPKGYWTRDLCHKEALKFKTRNEFCIGGSAAYQGAQELGCLDDICSHMVSPIVERGYWLNERNCLLEALKYESRKEFARGAPRAYDVAREKNILDDLCSHMIRKGNSHNKLIYAWEFPDNSVYIGLTFCPESREKHRKKSKSDAVTIHVKKTGLTPRYRKKTKYLPVAEAIKKEDFYINWYARKGWKILNRKKAGSIGGNIIKWHKIAVVSSAQKCSSQKEFRERFPSAYLKALENKWLKACYSHLKEVRKPPGFWTEDNIQKVALKCKTRVEFEKKYGSAMDAARKKKIENKVCAHMKYMRLPNNSWSFEKCLEIAMKCNSKIEFIRKHRLAYIATRCNGWNKIIYWAMGWKEYY